jgi:hypothetical protein
LTNPLRAMNHGCAATGRRSDAPASALVCLTASILLASCDSTDWRDVGYSDGYAATINTACKFRSTMIDGKFDNAEYAQGYSLGANAGAAAVAEQGCDRLK